MRQAPSTIMMSEEHMALYRQLCPTEFRLWARLFWHLCGRWPARVGRERVAWAERMVHGR